jgi:SAM-dependent methyltransferase
MPTKLSDRLSEIIDALPLRKGIRVLEIGCGTGAAAREVARRIGNGQILAIDRSAKAIQIARNGSQEEMSSNTLLFRQVAIEKFQLDKNEKPFDIAFAIRVGALDGRHPEIEKLALMRIAKALTRKGKLFIDGGDPLKEISLKNYMDDRNDGEI